MNTVDTKKLTKEEKAELKRLEKIKEIIENAEKNVSTLLAKYKDNCTIIRTEEEYKNYIDAAIKEKEVSIDTETTGLNPYRDKIVGLCLYVEGQKEAYIPINHINYIDGTRLPNQLSEDIISKHLNKLSSNNTFIVMHNANFDIRVLRRIGSYLTCHWDTSIAANVLNENEDHRLKKLHSKYVLNGAEDEYTFAEIFNTQENESDVKKSNISFDNIPIETAAPYGAHDPKITKELKDYQLKELMKPENADLYKLFTEIEMPCVEAVIDMEDTGFALDMEYQQILHEKYHKLLEDEQQKLINELKKQSQKFEDWKNSPDANKLVQKVDKSGKLKFDKKGNPEYEKTKREKLPENIEDINIGSPTQLSILLYNIMGLKHSSNKDKPESTSETALKSINNEFVNMILNYRSFSKMIDAFIDSLPEYIESDGKIHCKLNQYGARTGRFSCSQPNLQQIPARNKEIRKLFIAPTYYREVENKNNILVFKNTEEIDINGKDNWVFVKDLQVGDTIYNSLIKHINIKEVNIEIEVDSSISTIKTRERYVLLGSDYSQQEPKLLAVLCQDETMMKDASEGKDLYSAVAAKAFNTTYEDCLEHFPKGTPIIQENGKWRYATEMEICNEKYDKLADGENDTYDDGKARRTQAKVILLGMMYSRGPKALAEQLECSLEEAQEIMDSVFTAFPNIKQCDTDSKEFAKEYGYTATLWGRRRRLDDIMLPQYDFDFSKSVFRFNANEENRLEKENEFKNAVFIRLKKYWDFTNKQKVIKNAEKNYGVKIKDNSGFIAAAERQVLNARVQGSAADMTKKALIAINRNQRLKELGFSLIVPIHDEILAQCPLANIKECKEIFTYEMSNAANDKVDIKITVDPAISFQWYGEPILVE